MKLSTLFRRPHVNPRRDWVFLITFCIVALGVLGAYNYWLFNDVAAGGIFGTSHAAPAVPVTASAVTAVKEVITDRASEEQKYLDGTYSFVDPSK